MSAAKKRRRQIRTSDTSACEAALRDVRRGAVLPNDRCVLANEGCSEGLQDHHFLGMRNDPEHTVPVCPTDHAMWQEQLRAAGVPMHKPEMPLEQIAVRVNGVRVALRVLTEAVETIHDDINNLTKENHHEKP